MENSSARNFSYVSIGRIIAIILQALFYLLFAKFLGPESYGQLNVIIALAGVFSVLSRFGLNTSLQVYQAKQNSKMSDQIKTLFLLSTTVASLILIPIDMFAAVLCMGLSFYVMTQHDLLGLRQYKKYMINSILKSGLFFVLPIGLYFILDISGILLGMAIASFFGSIPFIRNLKIVSFVALKNNYKVLVQNFVVDASNLSVMVDKLIISYFFGFFIVGVYQFNLQIFMALSALPGILSIFLISEESSGQRHGKIIKLSILVSVGLVLAAILLIPFVVTTFFSNYSEGILSLQILVITLIPYTLATPYGAKLLASESTKVGIIPLVSIASLSILIVILGHFFDLVGLSLAVLFSSIISAFLTFILYRKTIN